MKTIEQRLKECEEDNKELKSKVTFFTNKSQRLEKENKELKEQVQVLAEKLVNIAGAEGLIKLNINFER